MTTPIEACPHCGKSVRRAKLGGEEVSVEVESVGPIHGYDQRDLVVANGSGTVKLRESLFDSGLEAYPVHLCAGLVEGWRERRQCGA